MKAPVLVIVSPTLCRWLSVVIDAEAVTVWPVILVRAPMSEELERHERVHVRQQLEVIGLVSSIMTLLVLGALDVGVLDAPLQAWVPWALVAMSLSAYFVLYALQFAVTWWRVGALYEQLAQRYEGIDSRAKAAYVLMPLEQEAYAVQAGASRRVFGWLAYKLPEQPVIPWLEDGS